MAIFLAGLATQLRWCRRHNSRPSPALTKSRNLQLNCGLCQWCSHVPTMPPTNRRHETSDRLQHNSVVASLINCKSAGFQIWRRKHGFFDGQSRGTGESRCGLYTEDLLLLFCLRWMGPSFRFFGATSKNISCFGVDVRRALHFTLVYSNKFRIP